MMISLMLRDRRNRLLLLVLKLVLEVLDVSYGFGFFHLVGFHVVFYVFDFFGRGGFYMLEGRDVVRVF